MAKPTLYHYFASKEEILTSIHEEFINALIAREEDRRRGIPMPASQMLLESMADMLELMETHRGHVRVFLEHFRQLSDAAQTKLKVKRDHYEALIKDTIGRGVTNGEFRNVPIGLTAFAIVGMCTWAYQWYSREGEKRPREIAYIFWELTMRGLSLDMAANSTT
jgi:AcrR family transcriptional regulator